MAEFRWNVQPYQFLSELTNNYTRVVIGATRSKGLERAAEAEEWMKNNAPWRDRSEFLRSRIRQAYAEGRTEVEVPARHAREALSVTPVEDPNTKRHYDALVEQAKKADIELLKATNIAREAANVGRSPSKMLKPLEKLPKSRSRAATIEREIRVLRGPIMELRFSHGKDIWYARWLEIAHGGRWGIISRAVGHWGEILNRDIQRIANLVQFNITSSEELITEEQRFAEHVEAKNRFYAESGSARQYEPWSEEQAMRVRESRRRYARAKRAEREMAAAQIRAMETVNRLEAEEARRKFASQTGGFYNPNKGKRR